jgi:hypothetical protein
VIWKRYETWDCVLRSLAQMRLEFTEGPGSSYRSVRTVAVSGDPLLKVIAW